MNFIEFVNSHKAEAYEIDMGEEFGNVWHILRTWQRKLSNAESPEEIQEVRQFAKKAYLSTKEGLLRLLEFPNLTKRHLSEIRIYFEYKELYEKAEEPKSEVSELNKIKEIAEYEDFFTDNAMLTDRNRFKNEFRKKYLKDPETIGRLIADFENDKKLRSLSGNFSRRHLYKILISGFDPLRDNGHKKVENDLNKAYSARKEEIDNNKNNSANI